MYISAYFISGKSIGGRRGQKRKIPAKSEPSSKLKAHLQQLEEEKKKAEKKEKREEEEKKGEDSRQPKEVIISVFRIVKRY